MRPIPPSFTLLSELLKLPAALAWHWYQAARRAQWSDSHAWYQQLLLLEHFGHVERAAETVCSPIRLVQQLELLVQERCLRRRAATAIEDAILALVDGQGAWR